jgi:hypothetical protein
MLFRSVNLPSESSMVHMCFTTKVNHQSTIGQSFLSCLKYVNANGEGEFVNGLAPDVPLLDNILEARPFGDINDPMLNAALVLATGGSLSGSKLAGSKPYTPIYDVIIIERRNVQLFQFNR